MLAMPFGRVVVATRVGDLPYAVQDGTTGLLTEARVDDIVETLIWTLSHPEELEKIRRNAKSWVETEASWEKIVDSVVGVYKKCRH